MKTNSAVSIGVINGIKYIYCGSQLKLTETGGGAAGFTSSMTSDPFDRTGTDLGIQYVSHSDSYEGTKLKVSNVKT